MNESIKKKISALLREQRFAVIATQGKTEPYTNLVSFLAREDLKKIYFPTSKNTKKFRNLSKNSGISVLIDNRNNKPKDIENAIAVTAVGKTRDILSKKIVKDFLKKHPYLEKFVNSSDCAMIEINIERYIMVDSFSKVNIFSL